MPPACDVVNRLNTDDGQHFAVRGYVTSSISYSHYASWPPVPYFQDGGLLEVSPGHDIQQISRLR
jgi:hypothetical protein